MPGPVQRQCGLEGRFTLRGERPAGHDSFFRIETMVMPPGLRTLCSAAAKHKDRTCETPDGELSVQSFPGLLAGLSSLTAIELGHEKTPCDGVPMLSKMTSLQAKAFELHGSEPHPAPSLGSARKARPPPADSPQA